MPHHYSKFTKAFFLGFMGTKNEHPPDYFGYVDSSLKKTNVGLWAN